ncbi:MAG TPA: class I SAM-dependent methyltransferase [Nocardioidaceae bacterium]|nr:class I SAM-dependent methyltransferase [Nocardioidaceae bacterium]
MRWWNEQLVPRATDLLLGAREIHKLRERVCQGLAGDVLEIGFGSGLNVEHLPPAVDRLFAVEPSDVAWHIAEHKHMGAGRPPVVRAGLDGQELDLADASMDSALSTFTLCTIPHLEVALKEVHRVLRPGGELHFLEHGLAPDPGVAKWQRRLTPVQRRMAAGCHLDRPIADAVEASGLVLEDLETFYLGGAIPGIKIAGHLYLGRAVRR